MFSVSTADEDDAHIINGEQTIQYIITAVLFQVVLHFPTVVADSRCNVDSGRHVVGSTSFQPRMRGSSLNGGRQFGLDPLSSDFLESLRVSGVVDGGKVLFVIDESLKFFMRPLLATLQDVRHPGCGEPRVDVLGALLLQQNVKELLTDGGHDEQMLLGHVLPLG